MQFTRRQILPLLAAVGARPQSLLADEATHRRRTAHVQLGAQTNAWPIDAKNPDSFFDVLRQIRATGYDGFETGYFNLIDHTAHAAEVRSRIAATGLTFFGLHVSIPSLRNDPQTLIPPAAVYRSIAPAAIAFGAQNLILSGTAAKSGEEAKHKAAALVEAARFGESIGLPVLYHNHEGEFSGQGEEMETLFNETEHSPVRFLLDAGHAYRGGSDVVALVKRRLPRIAAFHMRDFVGRTEVPLGQGSFPLAQFAQVLRDRQWSGWALNEEDGDGKQKLGLTVIEPAYRALSTALGEDTGK